MSLFLPVEPPLNVEAMFHPWVIPPTKSTLPLFKPNIPLREEATIEEIDGVVAVVVDETLKSRVETALAVIMNLEAVMLYYYEDVRKMSQQLSIYKKQFDKK